MKNKLFILATAAIMACTTQTSCKKDQASRTDVVCFVCSDQGGNQLQVICAQNEQSARDTLNSSCPGGCGITPEQFRNKCPKQ